MLKHEFFSLLSEQGLKVNDEIVNVNFENTPTEKIVITDSDWEKCSIVGQEGFNTWSALEALELLKRCEALIHENASYEEEREAYNKLVLELKND